MAVTEVIESVRLPDVKEELTATLQKAKRLEAVVQILEQDRSRQPVTRGATTATPQRQRRGPKMDGGWRVGQDGRRHINMGDGTRGVIVRAYEGETVEQARARTRAKRAGDSIGNGDA